MALSHFGSRRLRLVCLVIAWLIPTAPWASSSYEPVVGQAGKDVVWIPTSQALVEKMLDLAKISPGDYLIDLGSGDGRTVITAAKRGVRALGVEYNAEMVALAKKHAAEEGVSDKAGFVQADIFETDFSGATVITMFLLPTINSILRPRILDMKPGTRIVSNSFDMGEWEADKTVTAHTDCSTYCTAHLWIVPAKVEGTWKLPQGELALRQTFQRLSGSMRSKGTTLQITNGSLTGEEIRFTAGKSEYAGRVNGNAMEGTFTSGTRTAKWSAKRISQKAGPPPVSVHNPVRPVFGEGLHGLPDPFRVDAGRHIEPGEKQPLTGRDHSFLSRLPGEARVGIDTDTGRNLQ